MLRSRSCLRRYYLGLMLTPGSKVWRYFWQILPPEVSRTHFVTCCLTNYFDSKISKKIAKFSGDKEDMSGGTIGDPQTPPVWAPFVTKAFFDALCRDSQDAWIYAPLNREWSTIHYFSNYLYDVVLWVPDSE